MFRHMLILIATARRSVRTLLESRPHVVFLVLVALTRPAGALAQTPEEVSTILKRFAQDYRVDPTLTEPVVFGVRVNGRWWTVKARPVSAGSPAAVTVSDGKPSERTFFFFLDGETLRKLDAGELNPRTALGKTRHSDPAPMDIDPTHPDVVWDDAFNRRVNAVANHFWIRGTPEFLAFNRGASRVLHGANAVLLHYAQGFRSVWYQIEPGQHINADPGDQVNPFPSLFIFMNGKAKARIGGVETDVVEGTATLIPAGMSHEFWNPSEAPFEFILIMFGEGA